MAIFRAGKRVGPFDIRVGFPRDKSLDNVDRDPRLKQRANTENTIGRFRASMARAEGFARAARFAVRIFPPINIAKIAAQEYAGGDAGGGNVTVTYSYTTFNDFTVMHPLDPAPLWDWSQRVCSGWLGAEDTTRV